MEADELLRAGRVDESLASLQTAVRKAPSDAKLRVFLAQLLMVQGAWERALSQLQVAAQLDPSNSAMAYAYRGAIAAERTRAAVFAGRTLPELFGEPEPWMAALLDAVQAMAANEGASSSADIADRIQDALGQAQPVPGEIDGTPFEWLGDADSRLGPMFEMVINGRYFWVPGQYVSRLRFEPPADLRDLVWLPGEAQWVNGGSSPVFMPTRYMGSESEATDFRLARRTEFRERVQGVWEGIGQRMLATDSGEYSLLDVREIVFSAQQR